MQVILSTLRGQLPKSCDSSKWNAASIDITMIIQGFLCFLLTSTTINVNASHLVPRKSRSSEAYDPYIICEGNGPNHDEGLPYAYSLEDYQYNLDLCSAAHGVPSHNVGCACSQARGNVRCEESLADPHLWNAVYRSSDPLDIDDAVDRGFANGAMPFWEHCWANCLCVDEQEAYESESNGSLAVSVLHRFREEALARERNNPSSVVHWNPLAMATFGAASLEGASQAQGQPAIQSHCGMNCSTDQDCTDPVSAGSREAASRGSNCSCRTQSSQYQPGSGTVAYVAACLIDMATGGKRDEEWPCPCNSSYVSHGCCRAKDGLVWEALEYRLGELVK